MNPTDRSPKMTLQDRLAKQMLLSMIAITLAAATPAAASAMPQVGLGGAPAKSAPAPHAKGVSQTAYIRQADQLCTTMTTEYTPAWEGIKAALNTGTYTAAAATAITASAKATEATFQKLRALPRTAARRSQLIGYFNATSERLTDSYNVGVDENNEEPFALGSNAAKAEIAKVTASEAIASYGFKVCGLS